MVIDVNSLVVGIVAHHIGVLVQVYPWDVWGTVLATVEIVGYGYFGLQLVGTLHQVQNSTGHETRSLPEITCLLK